MKSLGTYCKKMAPFHKFDARRRWNLYFNCILVSKNKTSQGFGPLYTWWIERLVFQTQGERILYLCETFKNIKTSICWVSLFAFPCRNKSVKSKYFLVLQQKRILLVLLEVLHSLMNSFRKIRWSPSSPELMHAPNKGLSWRWCFGMTAACTRS